MVASRCCVPAANVSFSPLFAPMPPCHNSEMVKKTLQHWCLSKVPEVSFSFSILMHTCHFLERSLTSLETEGRRCATLKMRGDTIFQSSISLFFSFLNVNGCNTDVQKFMPNTLKPLSRSPIILTACTFWKSGNDGKGSNWCNFPEVPFFCFYLLGNTHFLEVFFASCTFQERPCTFQGMASSDGSFNPLQKTCVQVENNQHEVVLPPPLQPRWRNCSMATLLFGWQQWQKINSTSIKQNFCWNKGGLF